MSIPALRRDYMGKSLNEADLAGDPFVQFQLWFDEAVRAELPMLNAMTLATVGADGAPSARIVLLKGVGQAFLDKQVALADVAAFLDEQLQR